MIAGNIPGKTQTVPTAIYFAVESGKPELANKLVLIMTIFSFLLIFGTECLAEEKELYRKVRGCLGKVS